MGTVTHTHVHAQTDEHACACASANVLNVSLRTYCSFVAESPILAEIQIERPVFVCLCARAVSTHGDVSTHIGRSQPPSRTRISTPPHTRRYSEESAMQA